MKVEVNKIQAMLNSSVPLDEHNNVENLSLQMKIQSKMNECDPKELQDEIEVEVSTEKTIERLRAGIEIPKDGSQELLH